MSLTNLSMSLLQGWTAAQWTSNNPVLPAYAFGVESDTGKAKFGNGTAAWADLAYFDPSGGVAAAAWGSITGTLSAQTDLQAALDLKAPLISPSFTTPVLGVASATSLATSAASPLLLTNGKLVTVALTTQTVNPTTLTIPNFASVADTFAFVTLAQTLSNKTFVAPVLGAAIGTSLVVTGVISSSGTAGIGYATGAGSTIAQITSRTTGVTISKMCGTITLFSAAGSGTPFTFVVTNTLVSATDVIIISQKSGTDAYSAVVSAVSAGSFAITITDLTGTTTEAPAFSFAVIKAVAA